MSKDSGDIIGTFLGLDSARYEYIAKIIAPFQLHYAPMMGGFMLIDNIDEYIVARVIDYVPQGELVSFMGQKWLSEVALTPELIGQDIKTSKVFYQVKIKLLGRLTKDFGQFVSGIKAIPHITSRVIEPDSKIIEIICHQALKEMETGIEIGTYWLNNDIKIHFDMEQLIGKRTFVFARAGYGKSNLMKILASNWKSEFGSLIIFDPEGEYSITDKKNRPGIMDAIPAVLITNRKGIKNQLNFNVYDNLKIDFRELPAKLIVPILIPEEKHEMVFFNKLMSLKKPQWRALIDYLHKMRYAADYEEVANLMQIKYEKSTDISPIFNNVIPPMDQLHDPDAKLMNILEEAVEMKLPIIIDISLLDSNSALKLSSTIVAKFFKKNQKKFSGGQGELNKITFVVEEAQSVIGGKTNVSKFIELAKEGRKYQLGCVFITQQPGSILMDILSQGDNFFVFHLLSKNDLKALQNINAHFSGDVLTQILSEPIRGKAYMWTSNQPFVLPVKISNFEELIKPNKSQEIQRKTPILPSILKNVLKFEEIEKPLMNKLKSIIENKNIELYDTQKIFSDDIMKQIARELFLQLINEEMEYLKKCNGLAINKETQKPFSVSFNYFSDLYQKLAIYYSKELEQLPLEAIKTNDSNTSSVNTITNIESEKKEGFCIVCKSNIIRDVSNNIKEVVCSHCDNEKKESQGMFCHYCGNKKEYPGKDSPLCKACWFKYKEERDNKSKIQSI